MKKKIALSFIVSLSLSSPVIAHADGGQEDYINPPVNPLPSVFDVSIDGDNDVPTIPPPINPLPAEDVFVQTTPNESSSTKTPTTPSNTKQQRLKSLRRKLKPLLRKGDTKRKTTIRKVMQQPIKKDLHLMVESQKRQQKILHLKRKINLK